MQKKILFETSTLFSIFGISLGVAFLIVSMAGFNGFHSALKSSIIDISGDIVIYKRGGRIADPEPLKKDILGVSSEIKNVLPFVQLESIIAHEGNLTSIFLQGVDWESLKSVIKIEDRIIREIQGEPQSPGQAAYLGKAIAKKFSLKVGDNFRVIMPKISKTSSTNITSQVEKFYVHGIIDFGKFEFNERFVITDIHVVQKLAGIKKKINGFRLRLGDSDKATAVAEEIQNKLGWEYLILDWPKVNKQMFSAIKYEKAVLFFVMLIMVVAAFFNVSTTLFLNVLRRYAQVSILKTLGVRKRSVVFLYCMNGLFLASLGLIGGLFMGYVFCELFELTLANYAIMPEDVYKLSFKTTVIERDDLVGVVIATVVICILSTIAPALRGASLSPVEGLKYE